MPSSSLISWAFVLGAWGALFAIPLSLFFRALLVDVDPRSKLANVIRLFMADQPIIDDPDSPSHTYVAEIHRGSQLPEHG